MGRMFRIVTEGGYGPGDLGGRAATLSAPTLAVEQVPFVEVGGPDGVVTSVARPPAHKPTVKVVPAPPAVDLRREPTAEPPAPPHPAPLYPAPGGPAARVLSVSFHRFPKAGLRLLPTGVTGDVIAYHYPDHPVSGEYRAVRDDIRHQFDEPGPRVVAFTAAVPAAGTTTVLVNLAVTLTQDTGAKVLVVDANFDRPSAARRFGLPDAAGLAEVLGQTVPLAWALQPTAVPRVHVLAGGVPGDGTATGMAVDFPRLLGQLRQWFDWVLVDAGVWADALGGEGFAPAADAVYLVTRQADVDRPEFADLRAGVTAAGGAMRGYVTTRE